MWTNVFALLLLVVANVHADVYLHIPRGGNNRLNGQNRNRKNNNRLFDSQNNNRGGYNVGDDGKTEGKGKETYIGGSKMNIQWTNQHQCNGPNTGCDIILQWNCDAGMRDGTTTNTPSAGRDRTSRGRHEDQAYYRACATRARDKNLFTADQNLNRRDARSTRQNPNGARSGLECPEERDYYPYHAPSPWKDIAILTNRVDKCGTYQGESQNVVGKGYCAGASRNPQPITQADCVAKQGRWFTMPSHNLPKPDCKNAPPTRDNQNGNTVSPEGAKGDEKIPVTSSYDWTVPDINAECCVLRIRYNISVGDYDQFGVDASNNDNSQNAVDIGSEYGFLTADAAKARGYEFKNNPTIRPMGNRLNLDFQLALNTNQTGRTFEDRSHCFAISKKENNNIPADATVHNLNVMGKRGNIVQVYPAVEYGFEPAILKVQKGDYVHAQWTGSLRNPENNDGEGRDGEDKNNIMVLTERNYGTQEANTEGHPGNSYPESINKKTFLGVSKQTAQKLGYPLRKNNVAMLDSYPVTSNTASTYIGCFRESKKSRSIMGDGTRFSYRSAVQSCANLAKKRGNRIFAVQSNGYCYTDSVASDTTTISSANTFAKWGAAPSRDCPNGIGRRSSRSAVYRIVPRTSGRKDETVEENGKAEDASEEIDSFEDVVEDIENKIEEGSENVDDVLEAFDEEVTMEREKRSGRNRAKLDRAPALVNLDPIKTATCGTYNYLCTRNNNFSNRSQKGKVIVSCPQYDAVASA